MIVTTKMFSYWINADISIGLDNGDNEETVETKIWVCLLIVANYGSLNIYSMAFLDTVYSCNTLKSANALQMYGPMSGRTPALATCQPRCECPETIPLSSSIIHMSDEELGCPGNYRQGIIAQWAKFQGNLQKH